jgi:hypothetical protein
MGANPYLISWNEENGSKYLYLCLSSSNTGWDYKNPYRVSKTKSRGSWSGYNPDWIGFYGVLDKL